MKDHLSNTIHMGGVRMVGSNFDEMYVWQYKRCCELQQPPLEYSSILCEIFGLLRVDDHFRTGINDTHPYHNTLYNDMGIVQHNIYDRIKKDLQNKGIKRHRERPCLCKKKTKSRKYFLIFSVTNMCKVEASERKF